MTDTFEVCVKLEGRDSNECSWLGFPTDGQRGFDEECLSRYDWGDEGDAQDAIEEMFAEYGKEYCLARWKITIRTYRVSRELVSVGGFPAEPIG